MANGRKVKADPEPTMILVAVREVDEPNGTRGPGRSVATWDDDDSKFSRKAIDKRALAKQMNTFCSALSTVIDSAAAVAGNYELEEVKVSVEVTSSGEVSLMGATGSVSGKGALEFTFKRRKSPLKPKPVRVA